MLVDGRTYLFTYALLAKLRCFLSTSHKMAQQVWLITGCSSGIGEALAKAVLARGDLLIATARAPIDRLSSLKEAGATTLELDSSASQETIAAVAQAAINVYGHIDVVVPNAGYLEGGFIEALS